MKNIILALSLVLLSLSTSFSHGEEILNYTSSGWTLLNSGTNENLNDIWFFNENTGYCVGNNGTIRKTTNGETWEIISSPTTDDISSIYFIDQNVGFICANNTNESRIFKTTNSGLDWNLVNLSFPQLTSIYFTNSLTGYASIDRGFQLSFNMIKTTNGGNNWFSTDFQQNIYDKGQRSLFFISSSIGWVVIDSFTAIGGNTYANIMRTSDGGLTWQSGDLGSQMTSNQKMRGVHFANSTVGFVVGDEGNIFKSTNRGASWIKKPITPKVNLKSVYVKDLNTIFSVGESGSIMWSQNGGTNWDIQKSNVNVDLNKILFVENSQTGYICGGNGTILKTTNGGVFVELISHQIPIEYKLKENYPNPFNPSTKIQFSIPNNNLNKIQLIIFDINGREIEKLVDQHLNPGTYEVTWNASDYSSGMYFYKLKAGEYIESKKMLLIK